MARHVSVSKGEISQAKPSNDGHIKARILQVK
jgi:hypothetical protein